MGNNSDSMTPLNSFVSSAGPICYGILKPGQHFPGGIPVIKVKNIMNGVVIENKLLLTSPEIHRQYKRSELKAGDLLLTIRGTTGRVAIVPPTLERANITQDTARIRVSTEDSSIYLYYALQSFAIQKQIKLNTVGQAVKGINISEVRKLKVFHPSMGRQRKIAQVLSTWDKAIETTEKMIENSKAQKKALMQQLLTGKKRIQGCESSRWKKMRLDKICKFLKGAGLSKEKLSEDGKHKCILYGELYTRYGEVIEDVVNRTDVEEGRKSVAGDVLIPASTTTTGIDLANAASLKEDNVLLSGDINILRPNNNLVNSDFLAYLFTHTNKHDLARLAQGITIIHLYGKDLKPVVVDIPPTVEEQDAIITVLSSAEKQIHSLECDRSKLVVEKKALMQQLLTGKKRVKVN